MKKLRTFIFLVIVSVFISCSSTQIIDHQSENWKTNYTYVFVHGLSGWGHYDFMNSIMPYWGMKTGSLMKFLKKQGFDVHDASVDPQGSAWDRACELYAQLTGSITDYGLEHSTRCGHNRFGRDFRKDPLIKNWDSQNKINILGHSFGGVTVRLLAHLMANGSQEEIAATPANELSPLFKGGHGDWIYSVTTLAAPHNGTTAYHIKDDTSAKQTFTQKVMNKENSKKKTDRVDYDCAAFDMHIQNATEINKWLKTLDNAFYFSYACNATIQNDEGVYVPDQKKMESMFQSSAIKMGKFEGISYDGVELSKDWQMNDGLVNTISAKAPSSSPSKNYDIQDVKPGIWNIMPIYYGDHMSLQGGFNIKNDVRNFYISHLCMINEL